MNKLISYLTKQFFELKAKSEEQTEALKKLNAEWDECEAKLLEAFVEEGVNSVDVSGLGLFSMRKRSFLSVAAANKPSFYQYLKLSGNGALLKEEVNPRTLTSFLDGHLVELTNKYESEHGLDSVDANKKALEFLQSQGASYFTERSIAFKKRG